MTPQSALTAWLAVMLLIGLLAGGLLTVHVLRTLALTWRVWRKRRDWRQMPTTWQAQTWTGRWDSSRASTSGAGTPQTPQTNR